MRPPYVDDLSHIIQQPEESARQFWTRFLTKKNQIVDYLDAEALAAFKHNIRDEWLARHLGQEKPKSMAALTTLMTRFCAGEDSWLASSNNITKSPGNSDTKDNNGRSRCNKHKRRINGDNTEDTIVNAGFRGSKPGQRKKPLKKYSGPIQFRSDTRSLVPDTRHPRTTSQSHQHGLLGVQASRHVKCRKQTQGAA